MQLEALTSEKRCLCVMAEAIWPAALGSLTLVVSKVHSDNELLQAPPAALPPRPAPLPRCACAPSRRRLRGLLAGAQACGPR